MTTPLGAATADLSEVESIVKVAGTSFYQGMRVLCPDRRYAMYAIYAFCRIVDDIVDAPDALADKLPRLADWRERIAQLYQGNADDAVCRVLLPAVRAFRLRERDFLDVIDGMQMDAGEPIVAPDLQTLDLYCDRVAAAVGRLSVRAFGDGSRAADLVAHHLGRALQLTNILRDIAEDAAAGRLYLPREWLEEEHVPPALPAALSSPAIGKVCARMANLARTHFKGAEAAMTLCGRRAMRPARLMGATYGAILQQLEQRGWERLDQRVSVPKWRKIYIALRYGLA